MFYSYPVFRVSYYYILQQQLDKKVLEKIATSPSNVTVNDPILKICCSQLEDLNTTPLRSCTPSCKWTEYRSMTTKFCGIFPLSWLDKKNVRMLVWLTSLLFFPPQCHLYTSGPLLNRLNLSDGMSGIILLVFSLFLLCTCLIMVVKLLNSMLQ